MNAEDRRLVEHLANKITVLTYDLELLEARVKKLESKDGK